MARDSPIRYDILAISSRNLWYQKRANADERCALQRLDESRCSRRWVLEESTDDERERKSRAGRSGGGRCE